MNCASTELNGFSQHGMALDPIMPAGDASVQRELSKRGK